MVDHNRKQGQHGALVSMQAVWEPTEADVTCGLGDSDAPNE